MDEELIQYYTDLLILQYQGKPRARATVELFVRVLMTFDLIRQIENGYSIDTSVGAQQDVLGNIFGTSRVITGIQFTRTFFGFYRYGNDPTTSIFGSFKRYGVAKDVQVLRYGDQNQSVLSLNDTEFRQVLRFKAIQNASNHSVGDIDQLLADNFGADVLMNDGLDMSVEYVFPNANQRLAAIFNSENLLPKPAGVRVEITFT
jgi:hypothetical protein